MDHQVFQNGAENSPVPKNEIRTSLLYQLEYDSSDSGIQSSVPSPRSGVPFTDVGACTSLLPNVQPGAFYTGSASTRAQTQNLDDTSKWEPPVNLFLPSFPDDTPKLQHIKQPSPTYPYQTSPLHLETFSKAQNQLDFAATMDPTFSISPPSFPSVITNGPGDHKKDVSLSSSFTTPYISSLSSVVSPAESKPFSFTDEFTSSDLYSDLIGVNVNSVNENSLDTKNSFQPELCAAHVDPVQLVPPFSQHQVIFAEQNFAQPMVGVENTERTFLGNDQLNKSLTVHPTYIGPAYVIEDKIPDEGNTLKRKADDSGISWYGEREDPISELMKALEESRKEVKTLSEEKHRLRKDLDSVSKKYKSLKHSCDELKKSRQTYKNLAEMNQNEITELKKQREEYMSDRREQSRTIDKLIAEVRKLEENLKIMVAQRDKEEGGIQKIQQESRRRLYLSDDKKIERAFELCRLEMDEAFKDEVEDTFKRVERNMNRYEESFQQRRQTDAPLAANTINNAQQEYSMNTTRANLIANWDTGIL